MAVWQWLLDGAGLLLGCLVILAAGLVARRRLLSRHGGTFELSYRVRSSRAGRGWLLGLGRYSGESLEWFRYFSLWPGPKVVLDRSGLGYAGRRDPEGAEQMALYPDHIVICCTTPDGPVELAMSTASLMGFQSWLEASPPGADWTRTRPVR